RLPRAVRQGRQGLAAPTQGPRPAGVLGILVPAPGFYSTRRCHERAPKRSGGAQLPASTASPVRAAAEGGPVTIKRLNHAVLYVRDVDRSVRFYEEALGFSVKFSFPGAAFLQVPGSHNDHDL